LLEILKIFVQLPESYIREISPSLSGNIAPRKIAGSVSAQNSAEFRTDNEK